MYGPVKHTISVVSAGTPLCAGLIPVIRGGMVSIIWILLIALTALAVGTTTYSLLPKEEK
jgi:hypothetical protein